MPQELMKEFIGKVCTIILFNETFGVQGKIVAVEENWVKVEEKNKVRLINGDMIRDISIAPEKYQKQHKNYNFYELLPKVTVKFIIVYLIKEKLIIQSLQERSCI